MKFLRRPFRYRYDSTVLVLIGINILIFILQQIYPRFTFYAALNPVAVMHGWVWQFVSYMFAHGGVSHILFNMLALFIFGTQVERQMGSKEFLLYYFVTGILAGVFSFIVYWFTGSYRVLLMGASGAIFAVQLAYATFFPNAVVLLWGIIPLRAPVMVLGFTALELFSSITGRQSGVAHLTHLAGFAFGWLYFLVRFGLNPWNSLTGRR
ncbi:rhomboid family intramembrane serine protease [Treponema sp. OttesenSCG-928-L16]|nr:rhomboid family intramembrane serine protease [Treponema sp. OttesenSCG-928-L16]